LEKNANSPEMYHNLPPRQPRPGRETAGFERTTEKTLKERIENFLKTISKETVFLQAWPKMSKKKRYVM